MRKPKGSILLLVVLLFLSGLFILLYPTMNRLWTDSQMQQSAVAFYAAVEDVPGETVPVTGLPLPETAEKELPYPELLQAMQNYNWQLYLEGQTELDSVQSYIRPGFQLWDYGLDTEIFGVLSVPKLELELPIYLGASNQHLADGVAVLGQTSIPIGGENTNSVIAGHRGWRGASYFRYITDLAPGDEVIITNLWGELRYRVVESEIIAPDDIEKILIQEDRELLTLLTCHPYASGGKQRYVVYCERDYELEGSFE